MPANANFQRKATKPRRVHELTLHIMPDVCATVGDISLDKGVLATLTSNLQWSDRTLSTDRALYFLGPLRGNSESPPAWVHALKQDLPASAVTLYCSPNDQCNGSKLTAEHPAGHVIRAAGAWCWQIAAHNAADMSKAFQALVKIMITHLEFKQYPNTSYIQREEKNSNDNSTWKTRYNVNLAVVGNLNIELRAVLQQMLANLPWLQWDGSFAACSDNAIRNGKSFPCKYSSCADAMFAFKHLALSTIIKWQKAKNALWLQQHTVNLRLLRAHDVLMPIAEDMAEPCSSTETMEHAVDPALSCGSSLAETITSTEDNADAPHTVLCPKARSKRPRH